MSASIVPAATLKDAEAHGAECARLVTRHTGEAVHAGELGAFSAHTRLPALVLRRMLIHLRVPVRVVGALRPCVAATGHGAAFDRFLVRFAFWRGVRRECDRDTWQRLSRGPVILMYHAIGGSEERPSCFVVPLQRFQRQMRWLKWRGYAVISLSTLIAHRAAGTLPPARAVVITFDDGFADNHRHALPVLREHGFPATVFVVSGGIGATASWPGDAALLGRSLLSASQLQEMRAAGIEIGAHTRTHPSLTSLGPGAQHAEVAGSRAELTDRFGDINAFAYPFGDHDAATAERVASAGFAAACCSKSGINDPATPSFALRRLEVRGHDSLLTFAVMLWRGHRPRPVASRAALHEAAA